MATAAADEDETETGRLDTRPHEAPSSDGAANGTGNPAKMGPANMGSDDDQVDFDRHIRPLLSDRCYQCHGPDEGTREADLRLDLEQDLNQKLAESSGRPIVVPGDPLASELYLRILGQDGERMPPEDSGLSLTDRQIERIGQWIQQGAEVEGHWAFRPLPPEVPLPANVIDDPWVQQPIDAFVLDGLRRQGMAPARKADAAVLIRRMYLDLLGLPPEPQELQRWLAHDPDGRNEALVDWLLAQPAYGERMASEWLDVARYSDTFGYQVDRDRFVWPWRDWVVRAFNDNMPFDQFGTLQIAGDLLPNAAFEQILPTTFSRLHPQKVEGGSVEEEFRIEYVADRAQTYGTAFLGLTFECCRCHSHKYDPITQDDYFRLSAFFDNIDEAGLYSFFTDSVPTPVAVIPDAEAEAEAQRLTEAIEVKQREMQATLAAIQRDRPWSTTVQRESVQRESGQQESGQQESTESPPEVAAIPGQIGFWNVQPDSDWPETSENQIVTRRQRGADGQEFVAAAVQLSGDEAVNLDVGNFRRWEPFAISLWLRAAEWTDRAVIFHRSRAWTDAGSRGYELLIEDGHLKFSLIHFWPGNAISVQDVQPLPLDQWVHVCVMYDGSSQASGLQILIDGRQVETRMVRDSLTKQIAGGGGDHVAIGERFRDRGFTGGQVADVRVFQRQLSALEAWAISRVGFETDPLTGWQQRAAAGHGTTSEPSDQGTDRQPGIDPVSDEELAWDWAVTSDPTYQRQLGELAELRQQLCGNQDRRREIMVMREMPTPRPTYFLDRGAYDAPRHEVQPDTPAAIFPFPDDLPRNRWGLARWTFDPGNPLTARVSVNRYWQLLFGEGLVRTPEDFGNQGQRPTHPELLDYLALEFQASGWDLKQLLRQMLLSATYQQAVTQPAWVKERDPENRWWSRSSSHRRTAETLRDQALMVGGLLDRAMGGAPVKPYDLSEAFAPTSADGPPAVYRRSLYTYWKRTSPSPVMIALDAGKRDVCQVKRERTDTPGQALVFLNSPQFVEAARGLAIASWQEQPDVADAIGVMYRRMLARLPEPDELEWLVQLQQRQQQRFEEEPEQLAAYLAVGHHPVPAELPAATIGGLAVVANTLMGLDEWTSRR